MKITKCFGKGLEREARASKTREAENLKGPKGEGCLGLKSCTWDKAVSNEGCSSAMIR